MAKNYDNDKDGGIIPPKPSGNENKIDSRSLSSNESDKVYVPLGLGKRQKWLATSFILIGIITLISFIIPEQYYHRNINILLLNVELLIIFARDIYMYFKRSCLTLKAIFVSMSAMYLVNIVDLLWNIPHDGYLTICFAIISVVLGAIYMFGSKN